MGVIMIDSGKSKEKIEEKITERMKSFINIIKKHPIKTAILILFIILSLYLKISEANIGLNDEFVGSDAWGYNLNAIDFLNGKATISSYFNPLETIYLVGVYAIFGPDHYIGRIIQIIASLLIAYFLFYPTKKFFGETAAFIACLLALVHPYIVYYSAHLWTEFWMIFAFSWAIYLTAKSIDNETKSKYIYIGILSGIAALSKIPGLMFGFVLVLFLIFYHNNKKIDIKIFKRGIMPLGLFIVGASIILIPWCIYTSLDYGHPIFINSNSGLNLYLGNNPEGTLWMTSVYKWDYVYDTNTSDGNCGEIYRKGTAANLTKKELNDFVYKQNKCTTKYAINYILNNPDKTINKMYQFSMQYWLFPNLEAFQRLIKNPKSLLAQLWFFWIFTLIGVIVSIQKWKNFIPFYLIYLIAWFFFGITVYLARYKAPTTPLDIIFAAGGLAIIWTIVEDNIKK
jgi:4-amino-4-deoxy-L-arabinose transferase-like glycosyltransferase